MKVKVRSAVANNRGNLVSSSNTIPNLDIPSTKVYHLQGNMSEQPNSTCQIVLTNVRALWLSCDNPIQVSATSASEVLILDPRVLFIQDPSFVCDILTLTLPEGASDIAFELFAVADRLLETVDVGDVNRFTYPTNDIPTTLPVVADFSNTIHGRESRANLWVSADVTVYRSGRSSPSISLQSNKLPRLGTSTSSKLYPQQEISKLLSPPNGQTPTDSVSFHMASELPVGVVLTDPLGNIVFKATTCSATYTTSRIGEWGVSVTNSHPAPVDCWVWSS